ncbi:ATPase, T2SS/T4P/T4SS family [Cupriavidus necator]
MNWPASNAVALAHDGSSYDPSITVRSLLQACGLAPFLNAPGVTEVAINRPGEVAIERADGWTRYEVPQCSLDLCRKLANALVVFNKATLSPAAPIHPVRLPDGQRGQVVIPPACEPSTVSMTIRIPSPVRLRWEDYAQSGRLNGFEDVVATELARQRATGKAANESDLEFGSFQDVSPLGVPAGVTLAEFELAMLQAKATRDLKRFFELGIANKLNFVLVGGTGSGKTTLMKMLADLVPRDSRVGTIEDTHELDLPCHWNRVHLFYSDTLPAKDLVKTTLRMKFDRVYLAELRGDETWDYLTLLNTGHQGGLTSVHANDCQAAFSRIASLIKQSPVGQTLAWDYLLREVRTTIDVVLFMENKRLTQLYYDPVTKWKLQRGLA